MVAPLKTEASEVVNVLIGKEGADHVRIKIALPPVDRHNVEAQVYIRSGPFLGALRSFFAIQELAALGKDVEVFSKTLSGAVSLTPLEHSLNFKMEHRGLGHIQVQGCASLISFVTLIFILIFKLTKHSCLESSATSHLYWI